MNRRLLIGAPVLVLAVTALAAGCGGGKGTTSAQPTSPQTTTAPPAPAGPSGGQGSGALTAEAQQAAAGDIPDNQAFLTYRNATAGYSTKYPEGWAQRGSGPHVTFQDKNNLVRIDIAKGSTVTTQGARAELGRLKQSTPSLSFEQPTQLTAGGNQVVKVVYSTRSAPNPVTGKRVTLVVDRYYVAGAGKHAVIDLGTPQGVDNVDAYRLMIESFRWR